MTIQMLFCYDHEDVRMASSLKKHLSALERNQLITIADYGNIHAGTAWKQAMETYLNDAQIILLLASSSFIASDYLL